MTNRPAKTLQGLDSKALGEKLLLAIAANPNYPLNSYQKTVAQTDRQFRAAVAYLRGNLLLGSKEVKGKDSVYFPSSFAAKTLARLQGGAS